MNLNEYYGIWAIEERFFTAIVSDMSPDSIADHIEASSPMSIEDSDDGYSVNDGVARISVSGTMMKFRSSFGGGCSTVMTRKSLRRAANDPAVESVLIVFDTPGGTVSGTSDLAAEVKRTRARKPVVAYAEDMCCSAGYWVASQCEKIFVNETCCAGSVGTFMTITDSSKVYEKEGLRVIKIKAGKHKGDGAPGTEITDEMVSKWQEMVDSMNSSFVSSVLSSRKIDQSLLDGSVFIGSRLIDSGFADFVGTYDEAFSYCKSLQKKKGATKMPASYSDIKQACIGADANFICSALDRGLEVSDATKEWMVEQNNRIQAKSAQVSEEKPKVAATKSTGVKLDGVSLVSTASDTLDFMALVRSEMNLGLNRQQAFSKVCRNYPDAREAFVEAANAEYQEKTAKNKKK